MSSAITSSLETSTSSLTMTTTPSSLSITSSQATSEASSATQDVNSTTSTFLFFKLNSVKTVTPAPSLTLFSSSTITTTASSTALPTTTKSTATRSTTQPTTPPLIATTTTSFGSSPTPSATTPIETNQATNDSGTVFQARVIAIAVTSTIGGVSLLVVTALVLYKKRRSIWRKATWRMRRSDSIPSDFDFRALPKTSISAPMPYYEAEYRPGRKY
ncbi:hypothetical protein BD289DRAFT_429089 [Coniella lustricola]|uniref:Mid2 domain-containing protein n=1 Tax=Coniella lustricola TaxID=2025994 RepID=A0A2T3AD94_9PEZI|nr:hypothetical protein BD289DRAFT_429089 [Coniella lustricola]